MEPEINLGEDDLEEEDLEVNDVTSTETGAEGDEKAAVVHNSNPIDGPILTKAEVQVLREASTLTVTYDSDGAKIVARKEKNDASFGPVVMEREITNILGSVKVHDESADDPKSAAAVVDAVDNDVWGTIASSLREEDELTLVFHLGVGNDVLRDAGVSWDRLGLRVRRFDGRGRGALREFEFHVLDVFGQGNSNRMFTWQ